MKDLISSSYLDFNNVSSEYINFHVIFSPEKPTKNFFPPCQEKVGTTLESPCYESKIFVFQSPLSG